MWSSDFAGATLRKGNKKVAFFMVVGVVVAALGFAALGHKLLALVLFYVAVVLIGLLACVGVIRSTSVLERVRERIQTTPECTSTAVVSAEGQSFAYDSNKTETLDGLWNGHYVCVRILNYHERIWISVPLSRWPDGLAIEPRSEDGGAATGDADFDRAMRLEGNTELWRGALCAEPRRLLLELNAIARAKIDAQVLEIWIDLSESEKLETLLDLGAALASALPPPASNSVESIIALAFAEPDRDVRANHYRWLVERGWDTQRTLLVAAADPDPQIADWAKSQLPPSIGIFR